MRVPPSGRVPEQGPDWFLVATEACGGGTPDLGFFSGVSIFKFFASVSRQGGLRVIHEIGGHAQVGRARPPSSWAARGSSGPTLLLRGLLLVHKKSLKIGT